MAGSFSLASDVRVLACPNCGQTINTSMTACPYCNAAVDAGAAEAAAAQMSKVNQACSDASYLKIMLGVMTAFLGLCFIPIMGLIGVVGFWFLTFAVPFMAIRWWVKFGSLRADEEDFRRAKRTAIFVSIGAVVILILRLGIAFI